MIQEKKRKLRNIALLLIFGLIGGTFAFTAFNQQAINDREFENRADVGGRVHDYFDGDENKDVFVENFGQKPILVRLQLSEFGEFQERGSDVWQPIISGEREDLDSWTTYIPEATDVSQRRNDSLSAAFNELSNLTFGYSRGDVSPPWYLPTFNTAYNSPITAAAGHARDLSYRGEDGELYQRATHPGAGTANFWSQGDTYTNTGQWPGQTITRETAQNLYQDRAPITLHQWNERYTAFREGNSDGDDLLGNYWVMDEANGWAYYARALQAGEATSYLLDASHMTEVVHNFQGSYYYGVHVKSELIGMPPPMEQVNTLSPDIPRFQDEPAYIGFSDVLGDFLHLIRGGEILDPDANIPDSELDSLLPSLRPGNRFTTAGEQFLYLGEVGDHEHMIIRNRTIKGPSWNEQPTVLASWYAGLNLDFKERVQPVVIPARDDVPVTVAPNYIEWGGIEGWAPRNLEGPVAQDLTRVNPQRIPQAFALSMADVLYFSAQSPGGGGNVPFRTWQNRVAGDGEWWFTRTGAENVPQWHPWHELGPTAWGIHRETTEDGIPLGALLPGPRAESGTTGGVRPALIVQAGVVKMR